MECICELCGEHFNSETPKRFCSSKCAHQYSTHTSLVWKCVCGKEFESRRKLRAHRKGCELASEKNTGYGRGWALGRTISEEQRKRISESVRRYVSEHPNKIGKARTEEEERMRKQRISVSMKGNTNWQYNKRHGVAKQGWYKGIYCDSSWELAFVVYHLEHGLSIARCMEHRKYVFNGVHRTYVPDFVTDEGIIEIKGYWTDQSRAKAAQNPDIKVLMQKDIQYCLDYTTEKYGSKFWETLYEKTSDYGTQILRRLLLRL